MRANRYGRQSDWLVTLVCGLALTAAGMAACVLRGFFFTGEMYLFLTVWFGLCGVLLGLLLIYMAGGRGVQVEEQSERRENIRELAGSAGRGRGLAVWGYSAVVCYSVSCMLSRHWAVLYLRKEHYMKCCAQASTLAL